MNAAKRQLLDALVAERFQLSVRSKPAKRRMATAELAQLLRLVVDQTLEGKR